MSLNDYKKKELYQQVLDEPDTFVGGSDEIEDILPLFIEDKIIVSECKFVPAILVIFMDLKYVLILLKSSIDVLMAGPFQLYSS